MASIITPPTSPVPVEVGFTAMSVTGVSLSPFTLSSESYQWPGSMWVLSLRLPPMSRADGAPWAAFLASLYGRANKFQIGPYGSDATPRGTWSASSPLVDGANQSGSILVVSDIGVGVTFKRGDYFQLGTSGVLPRLHMYVGPDTTSIGGSDSLEIFPPIRETPADNAPLTMLSPRGTFRLRGSNPGWNVGLASIYGMQFDAEEAL